MGQSYLKVGRHCKRYFYWKTERKMAERSTVTKMRRKGETDLTGISQEIRIEDKDRWRGVIEDLQNEKSVKEEQQFACNCMDLKYFFKF